MWATILAMYQAKNAPLYKKKFNHKFLMKFRGAVYYCILVDMSEKKEELNGSGFEICGSKWPAFWNILRVWYCSNIG